MGVAFVFSRVSADDRLRSHALRICHFAISSRRRSNWSRTYRPAALIRVIATSSSPPTPDVYKRTRRLGAMDVGAVIGRRTVVVARRRSSSLSPSYVFAARYRPAEITPIGCRSPIPGIGIGIDSRCGDVVRGSSLCTCARGGTKASTKMAATHLDVGLRCIKYLLCAVNSLFVVCTFAWCFCST